MASDAAGRNNSASIRAGSSTQHLRRSFVEHIEFTRGKNFDTAGKWDRYTALAFTVRDRLAKTLGADGEALLQLATPSGRTT